VRAAEDLSESGSIELTDDGPLIMVKGTEVSERKRFTVAHEIGHFALGHLTPGKPKFRDFTGNFSSQVSNSEERSANAFAAEMLMPERMIKFIVSEDGITSIEDLARMFGVSQVAMKYRLSNIGLVNA
jgi:Zn-dependent peptidase ImmA (M78 family)